VTLWFVLVLIIRHSAGLPLLTLRAMLLFIQLLL